jgi:hypothetical protein
MADRRRIFKQYLRCSYFAHQWRHGFVVTSPQFYSIGSGCWLLFFTLDFWHLFFSTNDLSISRIKLSTFVQKSLNHKKMIWRIANCPFVVHIFCLTIISVTALCKLLKCNFFTSICFKRHTCLCTNMRNTGKLGSIGIDINWSE